MGVHEGGMDEVTGRTILGDRVSPPFCGVVVWMKNLPLMLCIWTRGSQLQILWGDYGTLRTWSLAGGRIAGDGLGESVASPTAVFSLCFMFAGEDMIAQLPAPTTCCHASPNTMGLPTIPRNHKPKQTLSSMRNPWRLSQEQRATNIRGFRGLNSGDEARMASMFSHRTVLLTRDGVFIIISLNIKKKKCTMRVWLCVITWVPSWGLKRGVQDGSGN